MKVEYINPFVVSATHVFATMLECPLTRTGLSLKECLQAEQEISGIIGLSGQAAGTVVLSLSRGIALHAAEMLTGEPHAQINGDVADVVGELTNMVAGSAKSQLAQFDMSISLPNVIVGKNHVIMCNSKVQPLCILFESPYGPLNVSVCIVEQPPRRESPPARMSASQP